MTAEDIIAKLGLQPHPVEGGYYRETWRSEDQIPRNALPPRYHGPRHAGTCIYYLLTPENFSALHRLATDEVFHFYVGDSVEMLQLLQDGSGRRVRLGSDIAAGMLPQVVVPRGVWQGTRLLEGGRCALLGTTVSPGFQPDDYEHGDMDRLSREYPAFETLIGVLTR